MKRLHVIVSGIVQGVGFRMFTTHAADTLRLTGWVRNLPDDTVEVTAEGPEATLLNFLELIRRGPPPARVDEVQVVWTAALGEFRGFHPRH